MASPQQERTARVRRLYELWNAGDIDATADLAHPDIVLARAGGQGEVKGPDALRAWMEPDAFDLQVLEPIEFEAFDRRLLVKIHSRVRGAGSGIEMAMDAWVVFTFDREALITRAEIFLEHEEAEARRALEAD